MKARSATNDKKPRAVPHGIRFPDEVWRAVDREARKERRAKSQMVVILTEEALARRTE